MHMRGLICSAARAEGLHWRVLLILAIPLSPGKFFAIFAQPHMRRTRATDFAVSEGYLVRCARYVFLPFDVTKLSRETRLLPLKSAVESRDTSSSEAGGCCEFFLAL